MIPVHKNAEIKPFTEIWLVEEEEMINMKNK